MVLQDQVGAVLIEVLRGRDGKVVQGAVKDICLLLLSIFEKSLFLGVAVSRSCGLSPHPLRADDFGKEYRALLLGQLHSNLCFGPGAIGKSMFACFSLCNSFESEFNFHGNLNELFEIRVVLLAMKGR